MTAALKTEATQGGMVLANSHGLTLYYYSKAPGQVKGNGVGGAWHVIKIKA